MEEQVKRSCAIAVGLAGMLFFAAVMYFYYEVSMWLVGRAAATMSTMQDDIRNKTEEDWL